MLLGNCSPLPITSGQVYLSITNRNTLFTKSISLSFQLSISLNASEHLTAHCSLSTYILSRLVPLHPRVKKSNKKPRYFYQGL